MIEEELKRVEKLPVRLLKATVRGVRENIIRAYRVESKRETFNKASTHIQTTLTQAYLYSTQKVKSAIRRLRTIGINKE
jgi:hypothetical protein|tara:strand:+ start:952 stop:1188 length:237 start_codon:yes stop_codon:yes gene_type:complete